MIELVAFDLDGTLADTLPLCITSFQKALNPYLNHPLSVDDVKKTFGVNEEGMVKMLVKDNWQAPYNDFLKYYTQFHGLCPKPFDGIKQLIAELKERNLLVALVTGKGSPFCKVSLEIFGLNDCFDSIETGCPEKNIKTESLIDLTKKFNIKSNQMIYIGDTVSDVISCREADVCCLSAAWANSADIDNLKKENPGNVILNLKDLKERLDILILNK
ncbi:MAG: HAD hydrolase-like protein [Bacteroidales bacterium]|nr:HAD hydrolase-like protein [Bacteroidales bacterium]